ncbi:MAG: hypothetical protein ACI841_002078 [Planctomycetota bacterium]|jgi:hypothetical protein
MPSLPNHLRPSTRLAFLCLLALACQSAPPPAPAPVPLLLPADMQVSVGHYFGSILGGPRPQPLAASPSMSSAEEWSDTPVTGSELIVHARVLYLDELPVDDLQSLASKTLLVASPQDDRPIRGASMLAIGAGYSESETAAGLFGSWSAGAAGRSTTAHEYEGSLPSGLTWTLSFDLDELIVDPDNFLGEWPDRGSVRKRLRIALERPEDGAMGELTFGLGVSDLAPGSNEEDSEPRPPAEGGRPLGKRLQHEWILPDLVPTIDGSPLLVVLPSPFATGEGRAFALLLELKSAASGQEATEEQQAKQAAAEQLAWLDVQSTEEPEGEEDSSLALVGPKVRGLLHAFAAVSTAQNERELRAPLLHVSHASSAPLTRDLSLIADEETLRGWVDRIPQDALSANAEAIAWRLERSAWLYLAARSMKDSLPFELESMVLRHAGEVGRYPSTIEDAAKRASSQEHFMARLIAENRLFLEDTSVSARVRAYDWLMAKRLTPSGFDPLASKDERRAALANFAKEMAEYDMDTPR